MTNRGSRLRRRAVRVLLATSVAMALVALGMPVTGAAANTGDTLGTAVLKVGSSIVVTSSANPAAVDGDVTFTATFGVVAGNTDLSPSGDVEFLDGGDPLGNGTLSGQSATWTGKLPLGPHTITATYGGDANFTSGASDPLLVNVRYVPALAITVTGDDTTVPNDGTWSPDIHVDAQSDPAAGDLPHTRFTVDFSGIDGLTANQLVLQESSNGDWTTVDLTDQASGDVTGNVGVDTDLGPGNSAGVTLRLRAVRGAPAGTLTMGASLLSSPDGQAWSDVVATATQPFTVQHSSALTPTTTTVTGSSVVTSASSAPVQLTAAVVPSAATGTVTFLDNGVAVGAAQLSGGIAVSTPKLGLGYHSISASYSGDEGYETSTGMQQQQISVMPPGGSLHAITPVRLLDTRPGRSAVFTPATKIGGGKTMDLQITGEGGIPTTGVLGVAVNVTVVLPAAAGAVTVYPTHGSVPRTGNIDFSKGANTAGLVITDVSADGKLTVYNRTRGALDLIVDVSAWFGQQTSSMDGQGRYNAITPFRLLDTRKTHRMKPDSMLPIQIAGVGAIPTTGVDAVILNVTSVNPSGAAYVVLYPGGGNRPLVSTTQFQHGETRAGRVIVGVGSDGKVDLYNSPFSATDVVVDIAGWFTKGSSTAFGATFVPLKVSKRMTATQTGGSSWGRGAARAVKMAGVDGIPTQSAPIHASAVIGNLHALAETTGGYLTAYPTSSRPLASDLNFVKAETVQNLCIATLGTTGAFNLYNYNGSTTVLIDIYGWFG